MKKPGKTVKTQRACFVRESPDVRRQALIDAACQCLAEKGVQGASVRAICARAGVSAGLLTHYFSGIEALIVEAYRSVGERVAAALNAAMEEAGPDSRARLHAYVVGSFREPVLDPGLLSTWLAFWSLVKSNPTIAAIHDEVYANYRHEIEVLLDDAWQGKVGRNEVRLAAVGITAMVDGLWLELCLGPKDFTADDAAAIALRSLDALLNRA